MRELNGYNLNSLDLGHQRAKFSNLLNKNNKEKHNIDYEKEKINENIENLNKNYE